MYLFIKLVYLTNFISPFNFAFEEKKAVINNDESSLIFTQLFNLLAHRSRDHYLALHPTRLYSQRMIDYLVDLN